MTLSPPRCPCSSLMALEVIDVEDRHGEAHVVAVFHRHERGERVVHSAAITNAGQRIGPHFGEREQVIGLLTDLVVTVRELRGEIHRRADNLFRFGAELLPGFVVVFVAQLIDAHLETVEACAMPREVFANVLGDRFEILGDPLRALISRRA